VGKFREKELGYNWVLHGSTRRLSPLANQQCSLSFDYCKKGVTLDLNPDSYSGF
jgi:hypothetical protein